MDKFQQLFGMESSNVQPTCLLLPFLPKGFLKYMGIESLKKGKLYSSGSVDKLTLILTGIGAPLVGDAVLYLKETPCQQLVFLGACGRTKHSNNFKVGDLLCPDQCLAWESFSQMLKKNLENNQYTVPNEEFRHQFLNQIQSKERIAAAICATVGSLKLEEDYQQVFEDNAIDVVDMECSAFLTAAQLIDVPALSLLFITDIISKQPFYQSRGSEDETKITEAVRFAYRSIRDYLDV